MEHRGSTLTRLRLALAFGLLLCGARVHAHSLSLAVLTLKEVRPGELIASWQRTKDGLPVASTGDVDLLLKPRFPEHCRYTAPKLSCGAAGLAGRIGFGGLSEQSTTGVIHVHWLDGTRQSFTFSASQPLVQLARPPHGETAVTGLGNGAHFIRVGLEHIWLGWDHLLFVLGLFWLVRAPRVLVLTITAFTVAHSITLAVATFGWRVLPAAPVEAVIALSIACLAVEIARTQRTGSASFVGQKPWLVALAFGLLHGLGFANALSELELSAEQIPTALLFFNVGVELGQLAFVALLFAARLALRRLRPSIQRPAAVLGYYAMGTLGMYWFFDRVSTFI